MVRNSPDGSECVDEVGSLWKESVERYYGAYEAYLSAYATQVSGECTTDARFSQLGNGVAVPLPPVWVGYSCLSGPDVQRDILYGSGGGVYRDACGGPVRFLAAIDSGVADSAVHSVGCLARDGVVTHEVGESDSVASSLQGDGKEEVSSGHGSSRDAVGDRKGEFLRGGEESDGALYRGKHWKSNLRKRERRKAKRSGVSSVPEWRKGASPGGQDELASSWNERRIAENKLATQRAEFQYKRNVFRSESRFSEQAWELSRLRQDDQTRRAVNSRAAACGGNVETIVSGSPVLKSGTISPNSSISVDEERKLRARVESSESKVKELTLQLEKLKTQFSESSFDSGVDVELFPVVNKKSGNVHKDGFGRDQDYGPVPKNAVGYDGVDHYGRPRYYNGEGFRLTVGGSERGPGPTTALSQPEADYFL